MTDSFATLRASHERADHREGIPMVLALVSEVGEPTVVIDDSALTEGDRLAHKLDTLRADLAPTLRDDDMGVVLTLLRTASFEDVAG
jgi:hypothetical protein